MRREENKQENKRENKKNKGFTLVELIIVIAILAVISAIAVPNLVGSIGKARKTADVASAKVIANAVMITLAESPVYEDKELEKVDLVPDIPTTDGTNLAGDYLLFADAIKENLQGVSVPKSFGTGARFLVNVSNKGKVTISVGTQELYPDSGTYSD